MGFAGLAPRERELNKAQKEKQNDRGAVGVRARTNLQ